MSSLFIIMVVSLVLTLIITVLAIITSTSKGTDWLLEVWKNLKDRGSN